jgi:hypothetical protein
MDQVYATLFDSHVSDACDFDERAVCEARRESMGC